MRIKILRRIILICSILLFIAGIAGIAPHLIGYMQGDATYQNLEQYTQMPKAAKPAVHASSSAKIQDDAASASESEAPAKEANPFPEVDFQSLGEINPDINGWIIIEDTKINYPTVRGTDNIYYLNHLFDHKTNASGSIFMDYENAREYTDIHSILYGHHMKNGAMFADIEKYKSQDFYQSHPVGKLITPTGNYLIHFIAGYTANVEDNAWQLKFEDEAEKANWVAQSMAKSTFYSSYEPKSEDMYLTLSTCSYAFNDARYVLMGALEKID